MGTDHIDFVNNLRYSPAELIWLGVVALIIASALWIYLRKRGENK